MPVQLKLLDWDDERGALNRLNVYLKAQKANNVTNKNREAPSPSDRRAS